MNQYGLYTPTAGTSSAENIATNVGKFDICCQQISSMASPFEKLSLNLQNLAQQHA